jgi:eukaryotic-like serine/threonine-protein kinase
LPFKGLYKFEEFELDPSRRTVARAGAILPLSPKAYEVLFYLVANSGRVVTKEELLTAVWPNTFVEEANLTQHIYSLRKALTDRAGCIVTIPGRGYQFTAKVHPQSFAELVPEKLPKEVPTPQVREGTNMFVVQSSSRTGKQMANLAAEADQEDAPPTTEEPAASPAEGFGYSDNDDSPTANKQQRHSILQRMLGPLALAAGILVLLAIAYIVVRPQNQHPFERFTIEKVSDSQHLALAAVSPDGNYLASVVLDAKGDESLWVRHIPTGSERPILQDAAFTYLDMVFSTDGNYIYFRTNALGVNPLPPNRKDVYRIPVFGGLPVRIFEDVDAPISFIDKGRRLCFYRQNKSDYQFINADVDGGDEHVLVTWRLPYPVENACAPDGKRAAVEDNLGNVEILDFASASKRNLLTSAALGGSLYHLCWDLSGNGLWATRMKSSSLFLGQIVQLSYPGGSLRQITSDLSNYSDISLTADAKTLVTVQRERNLGFEELSMADPSLAREHGPQGLRWFSWLDDGRILASDEQSSLRLIDLPRDKATGLTGKEHSFIQPAVCTADRLVATGLNPDGITRSIYSMRQDGGMATRLTSGSVDIFPECTPDGRWLFYTDNTVPAKAQILRLALKEGTTQKVTEGVWFDLSSDGKLLATTSTDQFPGRTKSKQLQIFSTETLRIVQNLPFPVEADSWIAFSTDHQSILYSMRTATESTIWRQPLDSTAAVKVVSISGKSVDWIRPSPDATRLGLITEAPRSSAVLLRDNR